MTAKNDIGTIGERGKKCPNRIGKTSKPGWRLTDSCRRHSPIGSMAGQDVDRRYPVECSERAQKIPIVLGNAATPAKGVGHQREHNGYRRHRENAEASEVNAASTECDQRREMRPQRKFIWEADGTPVCPAIHVAIGTLKPLFTRAVESAGSGIEGECASATFAAPGSNVGITA